MSAVNEWDVESNTRTDIPYLQATMYYFVYHINTIALYRQEKPIILKTKNRGINNSRMKITQWVGAKAQDGKMLWIMITKFSFIEFVLTDRRKIKIKGKIGQWSIFRLSIFVLTRKKCYYQSHWIRNFFYFFIPPIPSWYIVL